MSNLYRDEIIKHAKENEGNLRVAIQAGLSFDELRNSLIREFFHDLKTEFDAAWVVDTHEVDEAPMGKGVTTKFCKSDWIEDVYIALQPQSGGIQDYAIGVLANKGEIAEATRQNIRETLNRELGNGRQDEWPWWQPLDGDQGDFNNPKTLIELYKRDGMKKALANRIKEIAEVVDPCLKRG